MTALTSVRSILVPCQTMRRARPVAWAAALALLPALPALAAANFSLTSRDATLSVGVTGGIAFLETSVGSGTLFSNSLLPTTLRLQGGGNDFKEGAPFWTSTLVADWNLWQGYDLARDGLDTVLQSAGGLRLDSNAIDCNGPDCGGSDGRFLKVSNFQIFEFNLDADAAFSASGNAAKGQLVSLQRRDPTTGGWLTDAQSGWNTLATFGGTPLLGEQEQRPWALTGTLLAGTYRLANSPDVYTRFETATTRQWDAFYDWDYSLRLSDTLLAQPIPEPGAWALMLAGLAAVGWRAARRPG